MYLEDRKSLNVTPDAIVMLRKVSFGEYVVNFDVIFVSKKHYALFFCYVDNCCYVACRYGIPCDNTYNVEHTY